MVTSVCDAKLSDKFSGITYGGHHPTPEIWFINGGFLYEVTTYKEHDTWLTPIMQTWQFTP